MLFPHETAPVNQIFLDVRGLIQQLSVFAGVSSQLLQKIQVIQNAAARFVTGARRRDHVTLVLRELGLHWLPVRQRIRFKTAVMV